MLAEISFPIPLRRTFYYQLPDELELKAAPGLRVLAPLGKRQAATGMILRVLPEKDADLTRFKELKSVTTLLDEEPLFPEDAIALAAWMSARWGSPHGLCLGAFYAHAPGELRETPAPDPELAAALPPAEPPELERLRLALKEDPSGAYLLRLADLERREAVYPSVFHSALQAEGAQGLLLVPDLNFMPPLVAALEAVFPGRVGSWHARLTPKKRAEAWAGSASGRFKIMVATRTGIFLPFKDLRLALMDGEHEEIYRQEEAEPFYHAREVLLRRAKALRAAAVLASPCPSIESWGAAASGGLRRFDAVPQARLAGPGPDVRVLDMSSFPGDILARPLADSLLRTVSAGGQALVIAARKGYASRLFCANCGWMPRCKKCGPGLTLLKEPAGQVLLCRRCGEKGPKPETCPACGGRVFRDYGAGTQKTQEALSRLLPAARIARFDGDVLRGSLKAMRADLDAFSRGEADVLVGTRIALRELGAPRLSLAAFIDADSDLSSADFRASEKAYRSFYGAWRLLGARGQLFIQTRETAHYVFSRLTEMDYPSFADGELAARRDFFYPPFSHIIKARFASFDRSALDSAASDFLRALSFLGRGGQEGEILGPVTPQGQEKRKFHSEYYLVKAGAEATAARCLAAAQGLPTRPGVKYFIEADPYGFQ